jgi:hypothetical protein
MSRAGIASLSIIAIVLAFVVIAANLPLRLVAGDMLAETEYTDLEGASLTSGDIWINAEGVQGPVHLAYHWCPGLFPGRWCVSVEHTSAKLETIFTLRGLNEISFEDLQIESLDLQALGVAGGMLDARIFGEIERLDWIQNECPLQGIKLLRGNLATSNLSILGSATGGHQLSMESVSGGINIVIGGDTFSGVMEIRNASYAAEGELLAPEQMLAMAQSLMRPLGGNRFGWEISGELPC